MLKLSISEIARATGGRIHLPSGEAGAVAPSGFSIDTRTLAAGDLFFALQGEHTDGHRFVARAAAAGAAGAVVARPDGGLDSSFPQVVVESPLAALERLASYVRGMIGIPAVAITGSNGKTTTKEMVAAVLSSRLRVHKNPGNYNNQIGVPLTMLGLDVSDEVLVTELGSNHAGEIRELARLVRPEVGVVTNAGCAHIGLFGSLENVVREKTDLLRVLPPSGRGVVNADSPAVLQKAREIGIDIVTFGIDSECDFRASDVEAAGRSGGAAFTVAGCRVSLRAPGIHNVYNALAAVATGSVFGIGPAEAADALEGFEPVRVAISEEGGVTVIDDTYNANPDSVRAALAVLGSVPARRRVFVMGEMLELGDFSADLHREVGASLPAAGVDFFLGVGGAVREAVEAARRAGMSGDRAAFFDDSEKACAFLSSFMRRGDAILIKGSRATGMDGVSRHIRREAASRRK
jgi:UDP-N-acetylmuramoyl-tripeptide--D-alanyl-D-alanine ligase